LTDADRIAELEEQVAYYRSELGLSVDATQVADLSAAFAIKPCLARMVLALYAAHPRVLTVAQIYDAIPHDDEADSTTNPLKIVDVYIHQARRAVGTDFIETVWRVGRRLSAEGREQVASALGLRRAAA
jgi:DNA-binding response OmpR family regulator